MKRAALAFVVFTGAIVALGFLTSNWDWFIVHLSQETGTSSSASRAYNFFSGFGSDIGEVALVGALFSIIRTHNCHVKGCWRLGKHEVKGTPYKVCANHHPQVPEKVNATHVLAAHLKENKPR